MSDLTCKDCRYHQDNWCHYHGGTLRNPLVICENFDNMSEKLCKNCVYFHERRDHEDDLCNDLCKLHNQRVSSKYSCDYFIETNTQKSEMTQKESDPVNPNHYKQGKVECIDAIESATVNKTGLEAVCVANVLKYLWRYEEKGGLEDVKKGKWYYERLLETLENKNNE